MTTVRPEGCPRVSKQTLGSTGYARPSDALTG